MKLCSTPPVPANQCRRGVLRMIVWVVRCRQGTPMILGGHEFGRTQHGNNNGYCQDNEIAWADWNHDERGQALTRFVKRLTGLRRQYAVLRQSRFLTAQWNEELDLKDSTSLAPTGEEMTARCMGLLLDGRAQVRHPPARQRGDVPADRQRASRRRPVHSAGGDRRARLAASRRHQPARRGRGLGRGRASRLRAPLYGDRALAAAVPAAPGAPAASLYGGRVTGALFSPRVAH
jgi:hypothetical protein